MNLTTAERYFALFTEAVSMAAKPSDLARVNMRIAAVSASVERYLNRNVEVKERTERFTPDNGSGTKSIWLKSYPITSIESVATFSEAVEYDSYYADMDAGLISFQCPVMRQEPMYEGSIVVVSTGGMADDTADFISKYPDIEIEVLTQVNFEIKRIGDIAMKSVSNGQSSSQLNPYGFTDSLVTVLDRYRRAVLA